MQVKCQRCDKLFNQVSTEKYCSDCLDGKPVARYTPPKKEDGSICIVCGKRFYPKNKLKKLVVGIVQTHAEKSKIKHGTLITDEKNFEIQYVDLNNFDN